MADPLKGMFGDTAQVSKSTYTIAGIAVDVFGLEQLHPSATEISVLWLLHPRLSKRARMEPIAHAAVSSFHQQQPQQNSTGLIAVSFDQRNHGSRLLSKPANEAWDRGNDTHAQDMFGIFQGTAADAVQLADYLPGYLFPSAPEKRLARHIVLGVSLGAHAAWQCLLRDARFSAAAVVVGCPDYARLMRLRARQHKRPSWFASSTPGERFVGSSDYPPSLAAAVREWDPVGVLLGPAAGTADVDEYRDPVGEEAATTRAIMASRLEGKRVLNMAGGDDTLVPYACTRPFTSWLKRAVAKGGWFEGHGFSVVDRVFSGVGHQFSPDMQRAAVEFVLEEVARPATARSSKM